MTHLSLTEATPNGPTCRRRRVWPYARLVRPVAASAAPPGLPSTYACPPGGGHPASVWTTAPLSMPVRAPPRTTGREERPGRPLAARQSRPGRPPSQRASPPHRPPPRQAQGPSRHRPVHPDHHLAPAEGPEAGSPTLATPPTRLAPTRKRRSKTISGRSKRCWATPSPRPRRPRVVLTKPDHHTRLGVRCRAPLIVNDSPVSCPKVELGRIAK